MGMGGKICLDLILKNGIKIIFALNFYLNKHLPLLMPSTIQKSNNYELFNIFRFLEKKTKHIYHALMKFLY